MAHSTTLPASVFFPQQHDVAGLETLMGFSEEHLRFIAESLPQIVWTATPEGDIDYMNARWFEYTGLTPEETYLGLKSAVHPDDYRGYITAWSTAVKTQQAYEVEYRFRRASDGMYRWHLGRGLPLRDASGAIVKWFGTCVDIHLQKEAERQLRSLNEHLESIVLERTAHLQKEIREREKTQQELGQLLQLKKMMINTLPMAAATVDQKGILLYANAQFETLFDHSPTQQSIVGRRVADVLLEAERLLPSAGWEALAQRFYKHATSAFRQDVVLQDGRTLSVECLPSADNEQAGGCLLLVRDISLQRRMDAVKSEFMSLASHQLRTPLTGVRWALSRLKRLFSGRMNEEEERLLSQASASAAAMAQTIRTMLSISRAEANLHSLTFADVSMADFLRSVQEESAESAAAKHIEFAVICPENITVRTDPVVLREIVSNLLSNAIKYTPEGGTVRLQAAQYHDCVRLRVQDTGYGIPQHQHEMIFTKFFRGENILQMDTHGTGLGLYLVSHLVSALGATIRFESQEGKGTTFTVQLPLEQI